MGICACASEDDYPINNLTAKNSVRVRHGESELSNY